MNEIQIIAWALIKIGIGGGIGVLLFYLIKWTNKKLKERKAKPEKSREDSWIDMIIEMLPSRFPTPGMIASLVGLGVTVFVALTVVRTIGKVLQEQSPVATSATGNVTMGTFSVFSNAGISGWVWLAVFMIPGIMVWKFAKRMVED